MQQKGLAPIAIIVAVVLVALAGGYFLISRNGGTPALPGVPAGLTLNPNCKYNDPDLCKFVNNFKLTNSYSAKSQVTDKSGAKMDSTFESQGENKTHMVFSQAGKENYNVITIAGTTYTKDYSDNKWWKQEQPKEQKQVENQSNPVEDIKKTETEDKTTYKKIGLEACGSLQCFKYQITDPANTDTTEYIWFDNRDYQLRRERAEGKDGTVSETEFTYSGVSIDQPSPTKDAKPGQLILPNGTSGNLPGTDLQQLPQITGLPTEIPSQPDNQQPTIEENP